MRAASQLLLLFSLLLPGIAAAADEAHQHELTHQELGSVQFVTSCAKATAPDFNRAVALLHSFQYEHARAAFSAIAQADPQCAMAEWGIAMSHYHGLWENSDFAAGRTALREAQRRANASSRTSSREKAYIDALAEIYADDSREPMLRAQAFEQKMAQLQSANPSDADAAIFHALALYITAPKTDKTFTNQKKCGEILEPLFARYPHHPGVAHYLIHCYDNPVLAEKGLRVARAYARIAPASAHAQHMPTHIFTRVGSWDESITNNLKSARAAARDEAQSRDGEARDQRLHAMDYLEYAYLQSGRVRQARAVVDEVRSFAPVAGLTLTGDYASAAIPARYAVELFDWKAASDLSVNKAGVPWAQAISWMAIGEGSARAGNLDRARSAEQALAALRDATAAKKNTYWADQVEVQRREVVAWVAQGSGKLVDAVATMRSAAELEESMDKHAVTPGAITPAREMLAQLLALQNQHREALAEYEAVLKVAPNRFNALYGAAAAADAVGDQDTAGRYYRKLTQVAGGSERQELEIARRKTTLAKK